MKLMIKGMHCPSCSALIKDIILDEGGTDVNVSHEKGFAEFTGGKVDNIRKEIQSEGYEVE